MTASALIPVVTALSLSSAALAKFDVAVCVKGGTGLENVGWDLWTSGCEWFFRISTLALVCDFTPCPSNVQVSVSHICLGGRTVFSTEGTFS